MRTIGWVYGMFAACGLSLGTMDAAKVNFGDILVVDSSLAAVIKIDSQTGDRTVISGPNVGTGTTLREPQAIAIASSGQIIVTDVQRFALFSIDPETGNRTTLYSGSAFINPYGLIIDQSGQIYTCDIGTDKILRFSSGGGTPTVIAGKTPFESPQAITFDAAEANIWVSDGYELPNSTISNIFVTKNGFPSFPTKVSGGSTGSGPAFGFVTGIVRLADNSFLVSDLLTKQILTVSPTGARTVFWQGTDGIVDMKVNPITGNLLIVEKLNAGGYRLAEIDVTTKVRTTVSVGGAGPTLQVITEAIVYPVYREAPPLQLSADFRLRWPALGTQNWVLETSSNLASNSWTRISSGIVVQGAEKTFPVTSNDLARFYRLRRTN